MPSKDPCHRTPAHSLVSSRATSPPKIRTKMKPQSIAKNHTKSMSHLQVNRRIVRPWQWDTLVSRGPRDVDHAVLIRRLSAVDRQIDCLCIDHLRLPLRRPRPSVGILPRANLGVGVNDGDRKSTRLNSSHSQISYAVFCLNKRSPPGGRLLLLRTVRGKGRMTSKDLTH